MNLGKVSTTLIFASSIMSDALRFTQFEMLLVFVQH
jgi:hypothetical protein